MALKIDPVHIKYKRTVGNVDGKPVLEILTTGGLYMNILGKGAEFEVISTGPHPGVAHYIAEQKQPKIVWSGLSKSDWTDPVDFMWLVPKYMALTDAFRRRQEEREHG